MTTEIKLDITEDEYRKLQEILAVISMTIDDAITFFCRAVVVREKEILSRFNGGEPAEQIMEEVSRDAVRELFGDRNG